MLLLHKARGVNVELWAESTQSHSLLSGLNIFPKPGILLMLSDKRKHGAVNNHFISTICTADVLTDRGIRQSPLKEKQKALSKNLLCRIFSCSCNWLICVNPLGAEIFVYKPRERRVFELRVSSIIINVLVPSTSF